MFYESINDKMNKTVYFTLINKLGKKFSFYNNITNNKWKVYASGSYKFYTEIINDNNININNLNVFRYKYNNINSIVYIKINYLDKLQRIIKTISKKDNFCYKLENDINSNYCYFSLYDEFEFMINERNLNYIQIEFNIEYNEINLNEYEELSIERVSAYKIKDNFYSKIGDLLDETHEDFEIYYIDEYESIISSNNSIMFYTKTNISETPISIYFGNYLDFNFESYNKESIYKINRNIFVFSPETIRYYKNNYNDVTLILMNKNYKNNGKNYLDDFIEFKTFDNQNTEIHFDIKYYMDNNIQKEDIYSFETSSQCSKTIYYITLYDKIQKNFRYFINKKGIIDFYYTGQKNIFSDKVSKIDDFLPDKNNLSINEHPNEIFDGIIDFIAVSCKEYPASAKLYTTTDTSSIRFEGIYNKFIGIVNKDSQSSFTKRFQFSLSDYKDFKYQMKLIKLIGNFDTNSIQYKLRENDNFKELKENSVIISDSNNVDDNPIIKIDENNIGVIFIEFIKSIEKNSINFRFFEGNLFKQDFESFCYMILKYNDIDLDTEKVNLVINNTNPKYNTIICLSKVYGKYPYIEMPYECNNYEILNNNIITLSVNNPYKSLKNMFSEENNDDLYIIFNSTNSNKFSYFYTYNKIKLEQNQLTNIYRAGENQYELINNNSKYDNILYKIINCNKNESSSYKIGSSEIINYINDIEYGILLNYKSKNFASILIENNESNNNDTIIKFIYTETNYNNIDSLININAKYIYSLNSDYIELNIDNFQEEESIYYAIISHELPLSEFKLSYKFMDLFNSKTSMDIMANKNGKGKSSKTIIQINLNDINEKCLEKNCTLVVYAKSDLNFLTKVYNPYTLPALGNIISEKKYQMIKLNIIIVVGIISILVVSIAIFQNFRNNKKIETMLDHLSIDDNITHTDMLNLRNIPQF